MNTTELNLVNNHILLGMLMFTQWNSLCFDWFVPSLLLLPWAYPPFGLQRHITIQNFFFPNNRFDHDQLLFRGQFAWQTNEI